MSAFWPPFGSCFIYETAATQLPRCVRLLYIRRGCRSVRVASFFVLFVSLFFLVEVKLLLGIYGFHYFVCLTLVGIHGIIQAVVLFRCNRDLRQFGEAPAKLDGWMDGLFRMQINVFWGLNTTKSKFCQMKFDTILLFIIWNQIVQSHPSVAIFE